MEAVRRKPLTSALFLSLGAHIALAALFWWSAVQRVSRSRTEAIDSTQVEWIESADSKLKPQVVQSQAPVTEKAPREAYLSDKNRTADRQTVSRARQARPKSNPLQAVAPRFDFDAFAKGPKAAPEWSKYTDQPQSEAPGEYVEGVKESEATALNTKEFVFYAYYKRIRDQLDQAWYPVLKRHIEKFLRKGRSIASDRSHRTRTLVTLNRQGAVVEVRILDTAGFVELDDAAIEAFNRAGPFPNPPKGLQNGNGEIQVHWDFILRT